MRGSCSAAHQCPCLAIITAIVSTAGLRHPQKLASLIPNSRELRGQLVADLPRRSFAVRRPLRLDHRGPHPLRLQYFPAPCPQTILPGGFSDRLYDVYVESSKSDHSFFFYMYSLALFLLYVHPRAWPETQSYMEVGDSDRKRPAVNLQVVSILSGTAAIWCGRVFHLDGGDAPSISLLEQNPQAPILQLLARFLTGLPLDPQ